MDKTDSSTPVIEQLNVSAEPNKLVPKFVTKVGIVKTESNNYIFSLLFDLPNEQPFLVERVAMDGETVKKLIELLKKFEEQDND